MMTSIMLENFPIWFSVEVAYKSTCHIPSGRGIAIVVTDSDGIKRLIYRFAHHMHIAERFTMNGSSYKNWTYADGMLHAGVESNTPFEAFRSSMRCAAPTVNLRNRNVKPYFDLFTVLDQDEESSPFVDDDFAIDHDEEW